MLKEQTKACKLQKLIKKNFWRKKIKKKKRKHIRELNYLLVLKKIQTSKDVTIRHGHALGLS